MRIAVLLKPVARLRDDVAGLPAAGWIDTTRTKVEANPYDLFALEAALRLVESAGAGEVVVVTLGGDDARPTLQNALEIGAHRAVLVGGDDVEQADALAVARVLAAACRRERPDLVLAGFMSEDRCAAAVGPMVAELLQIPSATGIVSIEPTAGGFRVERELEAAAFETVELDAPCLATVQSGIAEVRYPSLKGIVAARKKPISTTTAAELGLGAGPARVEVRSLAAAAGGGALLEGPVDRLVDALLDKLVELRVL